ncbi:MAG: HAD-IA family hydrolase [Chloroflexota bacterium]|nr:HAD-IA family hydrolase [Chloroflexota bacterium]
MIKVILFDVDGVLVNGEQFSRRLARDYGVTREISGPFFSERFPECLRGNADLKQELESYLQQWGWQKSVEEFLNYWFTTEHAIDEPLVNAVQQLRQQGIQCYLATNQEKYRTEYILEQMGFAQKFDGMFSSAYVGHMKPDAAFFEHIVLTLDDVQTQEILFWDDSPQNVATAREVGLHAEIYRTFADFEKKLSGYLDKS